MAFADARRIAQDSAPAVEELVSLCSELMFEPAEYAGAALAKTTLASYTGLSAQERAQFFAILAEEFSPRRTEVALAATRYLADPCVGSLKTLQEAIESPRQELFRRLNMAPGGTVALVEMRRILLQGLRTNPSYAVIEHDLHHLLRSWFNRGFLRLARIDWHTSAIVLEKLIRYEAVHAIHGWQDLHRRLEEDRRCFAFFHPQLADEPIIFIEVALTDCLTDKVQPLLDVDRPIAPAKDARCAIFYSITNCQAGLRGISFGNLLIKQVVEELKKEFPHLESFATISPVPGFRRWLLESRNVLAKAFGEERTSELMVAMDNVVPLSNAADDTLMQLCAHYLLREKRGAEPLDPVARFHLGNGAALERINWLGDSSREGISRSGGITVNYVYDLSVVADNHRRYFQEHAVVASEAVYDLAVQCSLSDIHQTNLSRT